jgi:AraC-like DNA-binding protein
LCGAYIENENYESASIYCKEGVLLNVAIKDPISEAHFLSAFAEIARHHKDFEKSYRLLDEAEAAMENTNGNENLRSFIKLYRAKSFYDEKKYQQTVDELLKIENKKDNHALKILSLQEMYYYLAQAYTSLGNSEESLKYYQKARLIDAESNKKRVALNANIIKKFDHVVLKEEIDDLILKSKQAKYLYSGGIVVLLLVILGLIVYYKKQQRKNKKKFKELMFQLEEKRQQGKIRQENLKLEEKSKEALNVSEKTNKEVKAQPAIDAKMSEILKKLEEYEIKELFLSKESTLVEVAKKISTNTTYLSKVINTYKEKTFSAYITDLRVDYAIERLSVDRKFRSFTIGAIAQEIGFKRSESFSKAFKVKTGLYPSYFIKELEKQ